MKYKKVNTSVTVALLVVTYMKRTLLDWNFQRSKIYESKEEEENLGFLFILLRHVVLLDITSFPP
jgi:hypothetical protein